MVEGVEMFREGCIAYLLREWVHSRNKMDSLAQHPENISPLLQINQFKRKKRSVIDLCDNRFLHFNQ